MSIENTPEVQVLDQLITEAGDYAKAGNHRQAAARYQEVIATCHTLLERGDPALNKPFLEMGVFYFQASAYKSLYLGALAEGDARTVLEDHAHALIRTVKEAILRLRRIKKQDPVFLETAYDMLIDGFDYLMASRTDLDGMTEAGRQMEAVMEEYRKLVSPQEFERVFKRLLRVRAETNMYEAIKCLFSDRNPRSSQQGFKRAREFAEQLIKATSDDTEKKVFAKFIEMLKAMSSFGEALALQEKGAYLAAAAKMKDAEPGFRANEEQPAAQAFGLWAKAAQFYYRAMNNEVEAADEAAIREYEKAAKGFVVAADAFPAARSDFASAASWVLFCGEAAEARAKTVTTRKSWRPRQLEKAKRQAGLIFFGLWLVAVGTVVAAIRILVLSVNAYTFLVLIVVCFLTAGVAAALIKAEVAAHLLVSVTSLLRKAKAPKVSSKSSD